MELFKFISMLFNINNKLFKNDNYIYIIENQNEINDMYRIELNSTINDIVIIKNSIDNIIDFSNDEKEEIACILYFLHHPHLKTVKSNKLYNEVKLIYPSFNVKLNKYIDKIENVISLRDRTKKELKVHKRIALLYFFASKFKIDLNVFDKKEEEKEIIVPIDLNEIEIKYIISNIIKSRQMILDNNIINIYSNDNLIQFNIKKLNEIINNDIIYILTDEQKNFIIKTLLLKDSKQIKHLLKFQNYDLFNKLSLKHLDKNFVMYETVSEKCKIIVKKTLKNNIKVVKRKDNIGTNNKNANVKTEDIFESNNFGTLGELLGKQNVILKDEIVETNNFKPYFKTKVLNHKDKNEKIIESLVLWDLENINYFDDFSIITRFVKNENQLKIVAFSEKYRDYQYLTKLNFELSKLKKRNWIIKETKKIADNVLIEQFHKYKDTIKELILVSNDSDFKEIIEEANSLNIKTIVLHRHGHKNINYWYNIASEQISLKELM